MRRGPLAWSLRSTGSSLALEGSGTTSGVSGQADRKGDGRPNQRYPLLFRDYLRADPFAAASYGAVKRALATIAPDDWDTYYAIKDPACDLILAGSEQWAASVGWSPPPSDA